MVPKTTCSPSKKLSPTMMTVVPPDVHPSLGHMALMEGVAVHMKPTEYRYHYNHVLCIIVIMNITFTVLSLN